MPYMLPISTTSRLVVSTICLTLFGVFLLLAYLLWDKHFLASHKGVASGEEIELLVLFSAVYLVFAGVVLTLTRGFLQQARQLEQAYQALKKEKSFEQGIFESCGCIAFVLNGEGQLYRVNRAALAIIGRPKRELIGRPFDSLLDDKHRQRYLEWFSNRTPTEIGSFSALDFNDARGQCHTLRLQATPVMATNHNSGYLLISGIDTSDCDSSFQSEIEGAGTDGEPLNHQTLFMARLQRTLSE